MEKLLFAELLQHYGGLLTERQNEIAELHYCEDLSFSEIADILSVSKQAVASSINKVKICLEMYEKKLNHMKIATELKKLYSEIQNFSENEKSPQMNFTAERIIKILDFL